MCKLVCAARPVSVCVMCEEGDVVRGVEGGVCGRWGDDVAGMAYGVDMCVCGVVRTCVGRCACEVCEMQRCGVEADDVCGWGVGCVCLVCVRR